ncbi:hypothetical protein QQF64_003523 [Cirrhinus molitorella]|uniref:Uncharacterized protein n=1 Tax=Cirrhinus molitorella TaxID=172907 RepID=A0ABR3MLJ1_9TELE
MTTNNPHHTLSFKCTYCYETMRALERKVMISTPLILYGLFSRTVQVLLTESSAYLHAPLNLCATPRLLLRGHERTTHELLRITSAPGAWPCLFPHAIT